MSFVTPSPFRSRFQTRTQYVFGYLNSSFDFHFISSPGDLTSGNNEKRGEESLDSNQEGREIGDGGEVKVED